MPRRRLSSANITAIVIAIIGVIAPITAAYFAFRGTVTPLELSINTTQTAEARLTMSAILTLSMRTSTQSVSNPVSRLNNQGVAVQFKNPNQWAEMHLTISQNNTTIITLDIPPGTEQTINLPPGNYQYKVVADSTYPTMTPPPATCYVDWQQSASYEEELVVSGNTSVELKSLDLAPHEICSTNTPQSPTPRPAAIVRSSIYVNVYDEPNGKTKAAYLRNNQLVNISDCLKDENNVVWVEINWGENDDFTGWLQLEKLDNIVGSLFCR